MTIEDAIERVENSELRCRDGQDLPCKTCAANAQALALVLAAAKEPRVYALGEGERKELQAQLDLLRSSVHDCSLGTSLVVGRLDRALTAALNLQEPFTVEELKHIQGALQLSEETVLDGYDPHGDDKARRDESDRLHAKLHAYIEARRNMEAPEC